MAVVKDKSRTHALRNAVLNNWNAKCTHSKYNSMGLTMELQGQGGGGGWYDLDRTGTSQRRGRSLFCTSLNYWWEGGNEGYGFDSSRISLNFQSLDYGPCMLDILVSSEVIVLNFSHHARVSL